VLINAGATDERLREEDCRANVVHVAPTRSMLADGLAQYLVWKKWRRWLLVTGSHETDKLFAFALRHSATRFGAKIVEEREFPDTGAQGAPIAESSKSSDKCPSLRRARRTMTCLSRRMKAKFSPDTCPIGPGTRARSPARRGSFPRHGTPPSINGAPSSCRAASRGPRIAS